MNAPLSLTWSPARQRVAAAALLLALITALTLIVGNPSRANLYGGAAYVAIASFALFSTASIPVQVVAGQLIAAVLLLSPQSLGPAAAAIAVACIIATAELLTSAARPDAAFQRLWRRDLRHAGFAILVGTAAFAAVLFMRSFPVRGGLLSIGLGAAACLLLAMLLVLRTPDA